MINDALQYNEFVDILFPEFKGEDISVKTFTFQVTEDCSLRCTYCYQHNKCSNYMDFDTAKKAIDYLFDNKDKEDFYFSEKTTPGIIVEFIGGEPLINMKVVRKICDYFEDKLLEYPDCPWLLHHRYSFSTNGVAYFNEDVQEFLKEYGAFTSMSVTIDGCKTLHDSCRLFPDGSPSYDICIKAALAELEKGNDSTKITLAPENIDYVFEGISNMITLGFRHIHMNSQYEEGWGIDDARKLYSQLKLTSDWIKEHNMQNSIYFSLFDTNKYGYTQEDQLDKNWCGSVGNMLALDYRGNLYPCLRFMPSSLGDSVEGYELGTLEHGIGFTEKEKERITNLSTVTRREQSTQECLECPIESGCSWCSAYNYQRYGTLNHRATFICYNHKAGALASKYFYKITNDKENYDKIGITKEMAMEIISEDEWNSLQRGE